MRQADQPGVLPLRPLTAGEVLDAAVVLLRVRGARLVALGAAVAAVEQALLFPLRRLADVDAMYWPPDDRWAAWAVLVAVGFGFEAFAIAALGVPAAAAAPRALLGRAAPRPESGYRAALAGLACALVVGAACGAVALTLFGWPVTFYLLAPVTFVAWICAYGLLGLAVPAVVVDRLGPGRALLRSLKLSVRGVMRTLRVRVLAYLSWFFIRLAWGLGVLALIDLGYASPSTTVDNLLMAGVYLLVNALAYPMLASLDVVLHLEARMRTEGLDISLRRALRRGVDPTPVLVGAEA